MELLSQVPCPVLVTDGTGRVLAVNSELLELVGGTAEQWLQKMIEDMLPPASRIFLQTHVWPLLRRQGAVHEIQLQLSNAASKRVPVMVNCRKGVFEARESYYWVLFVALERSRFEAEVLNARNLAQASSVALAKSERFVKTVTDGLPGLVAYWDKDLHCRFANKPYRDWFGKSTEAILGHTMRDLLGERLFALNESHVVGVLAGQPQHFESTLTRADDRVRYTLTNYIPDFDVEGSVVGFFVLVSDVTGIKESEVELRLAASVFDHTREGIMVTDGNGIIQSVNPAFTQITGYTSAEAVGQTPRMLKSDRHERGYFALLWNAIATKGHWEGETWNRRKNGDVFVEWQNITMIHGSDDQAVRYVSVFSDITERWHEDERTRHLALHDGLTGLPNRHLLMERLGQLITLTAREQRNLAVLFLDLDGFKVVNDTLGHDMGDEVLKSVARKLQALVRKSDTVARLGGDEFVVLLDNPLSQDEVAHIAIRIIALLGEPMEFGGKLARIGTSIGIAMHPAYGDTATQLVKNADSAMYSAKGAGKNTYRFFAVAPAPAV